jgi:hypothetical protein
MPYTLPSGLMTPAIGSVPVTMEPSACAVGEPKITVDAGQPRAAGAA